MTRLRQILHDPPRDLVFASDGVDGHFVAEIAELEGGVEAFVDAGDFEFAGGGFFHGCTVGPDGFCENADEGRREIRVDRGRTFCLWSLDLYRRRLGRGGCFRLDCPFLYGILSTARS
jgi:hypothetical protein